MKKYSNLLFSSYRKTHGESCVNLGEAYQYFKQYFNTYYKKHFENVPYTANILEIGCNAGYFLANLRDRGGYRLTGVDLSEEDILYAKNNWPNIDFVCKDAFEFLIDSEEKYDVIYMRAVFEHIDKDRIIELLRLINERLTIDGKVLIEVPNMDWIWASHERYMDFTHEVGFTRESLGQVMRNVFVDVQVENTENSERFHSIKITLARKVFGLLLYWSEPVIKPEVFFAKCIMGIGHKNIEERESK